MLDILTKQLDEILAERAAHVAKIEALPEVLEAEARSATDAEDAEFRSAVAAIEVLDAKTDGLRAEIAKLERIAERKETAARRSPVVGMAEQPKPTDVVRMSATDARAAALTFVERSRNFVADAHRESVTNLIERNG